MRRLKNLLADLEKYGLKRNLIQAGHAGLGSDLAMPCFALAKQRKLDPGQLARDLASQLKHPRLERVEAVNGYLNIWLKADFLAEELVAWHRQAPDLGRLPANGKKALIEYLSPNLAKPLSAGHLRNLFQGRSLVNLHRFRGWEVVTDSHLGDWGTAFGRWVVGFLKYGDHDKLAGDGLKELGRTYALIYRDLEAEKAAGKDDLAAEVQAWLLKLEAADDEAWRYHRLFTTISLEKTNRLLERFDVSFDHCLGESFYHRQTLELLRKLEKDGPAERQTDGSLIIDLRSEGIKTPLLIQKSNGATLYASSDLATLAYRQQHFKPQRIIYVVGAEQRLHFEQLFACNRLLRLSQAELIHHAYGLVEERLDDGQRRKMSSRRRIVELEEILAEAVSAAGRLTQKKLAAADVEIIAQGALVFQEFCQNKNRNILFDSERIFSLNDMSGPYVQYAALRLRSILAKAASPPPASPPPAYDWQAERRLLRKVLGFEDVLAEAEAALEVSKIAFHVFELCQELNRYYENVRVLESRQPARDCRLWLLATTHDHLVSTLGILGMKLPSRM